MGIPFHEMYAVDGLNFAIADRIYAGTIAVVYAAGGGAGQAVTAAVTWTEPVPTPYAVYFDLPEDATAFASSRTALGFTYNIRPRLAANTLAGGTFSALVVA